MKASRSVAASRGWETRRERNESVTCNLAPELLPMWERIGGAFKGDPHTRFEQFTKYVEEHPTETIAHMQASADAMIADRDSSDALDDSSEAELTADDLAFLDVSAEDSTEAPTVYTLGTERLDVARIVAIAGRLNATIVDVRRSPRGITPNHLSAALGDRYTYAGDVLGCDKRGNVSASGVNLVASMAKDGPNRILLGKNEAAGDCSRHYKIALPLLARGVDVVHIYRNELVTARDLQDAILAEDPEAMYPCQIVSLVA